MRVVLFLIILALVGVSTTGFVWPHVRPMSAAELTVFYRMISDLCGAVTVASFLFLAVAFWRAAE